MPMLSLNFTPQSIFSNNSIVYLFVIKDSKIKHPFQVSRILNHQTVFAMLSFPKKHYDPSVYFDSRVLSHKKLTNHLSSKHIRKLQR